MDKGGKMAAAEYYRPPGFGRDRLPMPATLQLPRRIVAYIKGREESSLG